MLVVETYNLFVMLMGLAGMGAVVSMLVNVAKLLGLVKDGSAGAVVAGLNFLIFLGMVIASLVGVDWATVDFSSVDTYLASFATLLGFILQMIGSDVMYAKFGGKLPLLGHSFSRNGK